MATTLTLNSLVSFYGTYGTDADIEDAVASIFPRYYQAYSDGTGNNQANTWWADTLSLTVGGTSLDLTSGMTDRFGNALTFTKIKLMLIYNRSTTDSEYITMSGNFLANLFSYTSGYFITVWGSQSYYVNRPLTGFAIMNGTNDAITLAGSVSLTADVILVGTR